MKKKTFIVQLLDSKKPSRTSFTQVEDALFYSNDTDASLVFIPHEDSFDFQTAKVVMYNRSDESLVERDAVVTTEDGRKVASYEMPDEIIAHWGDWTAQPVFISGGEIYSGSIVPFSVFRYLMHERPPRLNEVVTITRFIEQSQALVDAMVQNETQRKTQEQTRQSAEAVRVQAENERSVKYESYAQQFNDVITDLSEEKDYHSLPEIAGARGGFDTLGDRLSDTTAQLAQNAKFDMQSDFVSQVSRLIGGYEKMYYKRENSLGWMTVMLRNKNAHVSWNFRNNTYDDFVILGDCFYGNVSESLIISQSKNYDSLSGTWNTTAPNSHYTTEVGATLTVEVIGEKLDFRHYADDRGGIWEFVIDGDTENKVTISTFSASPVIPKVTTIFENFPSGKHSVVATFKGDDPENTPSSGAGNSRGWAWYGSSSGAFTSYKTQLINSRVQDLLVGFSNKEFAFRTRKAGTDHSYQFVPMHGGIGTLFKKSEPKIIADDKNILPSDLQIGEFHECSKFSVIQSGYGRNPESESENLLEINTNVTINKNGNVEVAGKMKPLTDVEIENGYGIMFPVSKPITTKCVTSIGNEYDTTKTDSSSTFMIDESDKTTGFVFVSSENPDYVASVSFNDERNTLRAGYIEEDSPFWIEHRDTSLQKLYFRPFYNAELTPNDEFKFSATFNCGKVQGIYNII